MKAAVSLAALLFAAFAKLVEWTVQTPSYNLPAEISKQAD
jgi:hypothetical protein